MKKLAFFGVLLLGSLSMNAQSIEPSLGLGALTAGSLKLETMYHFMDNQSANLELRLINSSSSSADGTITTSISGFAISPEYMYYFNPTNNDNSGWYVGPYVRFKSMTTTDWQEVDLNGSGQIVDADFSQVAFGLGANLGYHVALDNGLTFRFYMGGGSNLVNSITHDDGFESVLSAFYGVPFHVRSGVNVGYRF